MLESREIRRVCVVREHGPCEVDVRGIHQPLASDQERVIAEAITEARLGAPLMELTMGIADALRKADFLSDVPLSYREHADRHDGEFVSGCGCDWEREHNQAFSWRVSDRL
jgi:hypothetical protein